MGAGTFPPSWQEHALVTVLRAGGTARQFAAVTSEIEINEPEYPGESIVNVAGGRIWTQKPQEDGEMTLTIYPVEASEADNTSLMQQFGQAGGQAYDTSQPIRTRTAFTAGVNRLRDTFMVAIMWTDDTAVTSAGAATATDATTAVRFYAKLCRITSHKTKFDTENGLVHTVTFKFPPMNKAGDTRPYAWESTNDGDGVSALPALTYSSATDL